MRALALATSLLLLIACARAPEDEGGPNVERSTLMNRDWELVSLGEQQDALGAGGRRPTLRFMEADGRAGGFGGCNRWSAPYAMGDDSLTFGPAVATKMACSEGMELETAFFGMLAATRSYQASDSTLTLLAGGTPLATFRPAAP